MTGQSVNHPRPSTLLIGSEALVAAWGRFAASAPDVVPLVHTEVQRALDVIDLTEPQVVVMEQAIAASDTGAMLIVRLHSERSSRGTEICLLNAEQAAVVMERDPGDAHPQDWLKVLANPLPPRQQRQAPRLPATGSEQILIDGNFVTLVDWSATGAQVHSPSVLKPHTRVRVKLSIAQASMKTTGVVVWSAFEIQPENRYRVGIAFADRLEVPAGSASHSRQESSDGRKPAAPRRASRKARRATHSSGHR